MSITGAIGIDLGSSTSVIALASKGGVEILTNEGSHRETQNIVGFGENERFIGEHGYVQLKSNFKNTVVFPNRFLGMNIKHPNLEIESKFLYTKVIPNGENKASFEVTYRSEKKQFLPEQIVAMLLQKFKNISRKKGIQHNDAVISVPGYYTDFERKALLDAAKIAEVNVVKLMNEPTAIALAYGIFRKAELDTTPRNVAFVDFGHSHLSVFTAAFTKEKLKIINQVHDRHLGARDLDWALLEFYSNMFREQNDLNPKKSDKARLRLLDGIEKQRKVLSANSDATINIEFLMEDCDLNHTLTREKFESIIAPLLAKFRETLAKVLDPNIPLHSVEIVGGATRIPIIQKIITEVFKVENCSKTVNASECIARGCAIQAAMLSPLFKVADYGIEEANYFPIRCSWTFIDNASKEGKMEVEDGKNNPAKQVSILFDKDCPIPSVKSVTFHREESVDFKLFYGTPADGFEPLIAHYFVHNIKPKEPEYGLKLKIHLNRNGVVELETAQLLEDYYEEVLVPVEKKTEKTEKTEAQQQPNPASNATATPNQQTNAEQGQKEQELKKKKKTRSTNLNTDVAPISGYTAKVIAQFFEEECHMAHQDKIIIETYDKKNELESYIYEMRNRLNEKYSEYTSADVKNTLLNLLQAAENWLYQEGAKASKSAYMGKTEELRKLGDPITFRYNEYQNIPEAIQNFHSTLGGYEQILLSNDANLAHITPEERQPVLDTIKRNREFLVNTLNLTKSMRKDQNPPTSVQEINAKHEEFINFAKPVVNKPKPQPPKEEPKKTEPPKDQTKAEEKPANAENSGAQNAQSKGEKMDIEQPGSS